MEKHHVSIGIVNFIFFLVGMVGLWLSTHSGVALFWGLLASLHFSLKY